MTTIGNIIIMVEFSNNLIEIYDSNDTLKPISWFSCSCINKKGNLVNWIRQEFFDSELI